MKKTIKLILLSIALSGCASNYLSLDQVRQSKPQKSVSAALSLDLAYENVLSQVSECYALNIYKVISLKRNKSAEVSVISSGAVSGANIWLSVILEEVSATETKVYLFWGNKNWEESAERAAKWASGDKTKC